jgi:hypothetical protein
VGVALAVAVAVVLLVTRPFGSSKGAAPAPGPTMSYERVTFRLAGTESGADITYQIGDDAARHHRHVDRDGFVLRFTAAEGTDLSFSARNTGSSGSLTCTIEMQGIVISDHTSRRAVTCEGEA